MGALLQRPCFRPVAPVVCWREGWAIADRVTRDQNLGDKREGLVGAGPVVVGGAVGGVVVVLAVMPLVWVHKERQVRGRHVLRSSGVVQQRSSYTKVG